MSDRGSLGGLILIIVGLVIVIVQALNMSNLFIIEDLLRSLGLILVGVALQLLGLGAILVSKK